MTTAQDVGFMPKHPLDGQAMVEAWIPLSVQMNQMNRSMGLRDLYPFVLTKSVRDKLIFLHDAIHRFQVMWKFVFIRNIPQTCL